MAAATASPAPAPPAPRTIIQVDDAGDDDAVAAGVRLLSEARTVLLDCDGVLWCGSRAVDGAADAIKALRAAGKAVYFVTNNSTKTRQQYVDKMATMGIEAHVDEMVSSSFCAAAHLKAAGVTGKVYAVGEGGMKSELETVGYEVLGLEDGSLPLHLGELTEDMLDPAVTAVCVGFDSSFNYRKLALASCYVRYRKALLVATNIDATFPDKHVVLPGGGSVVRAVETASLKTADVVIGKPEPLMMEYLVKSRGIDPATTIMVGDRLDTDIAFGHVGGVQTVLVLTGVSTLEEANASTDAERPHFAMKSVASFIPLLNKSAQK